MNKDPKLHLGHFQRIRDRVLRDNAENFDDTLVLEMLLQLPMHRGDTNEVAKEILRKFGSFNKFCKLAKYEDLLIINGIGESIAQKLICFIKIMQYAKLRAGGDFYKVKDYGSFIEYLRDMLCDYDHEVLVLFILNSKHEICHYTILQHGDSHHVLVDVAKISELTRLHKGTSVVLSHNHPEGPFYPSAEDCMATEQIMAYCHSKGINFLDHIIVNKQGHFSFRRSDMLREMDIRMMAKVRSNEAMYQVITGQKG